MATVLVVDDSAFMRRRCVSLVKELGHQAVEACDGGEAIRVYKQTKPQAVLMDITMPHVDGISALREILAIDPRARVAMVTALDQQGPTMEAITAGAAGFLVKPFSPDSVKAELRKLMG